MNAKERLNSFGYKVVSRAEFTAATDRPDGLLERAAEYAGNFVVYDPSDDADGFMLVGDDVTALACEAIAHVWST